MQRIQRPAVGADVHAVAVKLDVPLSAIVASLARSHIGSWIVYRNGWPLTWFRTDQFVLFSSAEDAKIAALVHMRDMGWDFVADETTWRDPFSSERIVQ